MKQKKSLTKTQFEDEFVNRINSELNTSFKRKDGAVIINSLEDIFVEHATDERGCSYTGFMKCSAMRTKAHMGRNPATGESIKIPSKIRGKATLLKSMKDRLREAGEHAFGKLKGKSSKVKGKHNKHKKHSK